LEGGREGGRGERGVGSYSKIEEINVNAVVVRLQFYAWFKQYAFLQQ